MTVVKPWSTYGRSRSAIASAGPRSGGTPAIASIPFVAQMDANARRASAGSSRITAGKLTVRSIVAGSRPTAAQCSRRIASRASTSSSVPDVFQASACRATIRRVFLGPLPPTRMRKRGWSGSGEITASIKPVRRAVMVDALAVEEAADDAEGFVEAVEALAGARAEVDPVRGVLPLHVRGPEAQDGPTAADVVQRRRELRRVAGRPERVGAHHETHADAARAGGEGADRHPSLEDGLLPRPLDRGQVVPRPERVPARGLGCLSPRARSPASRTTATRAGRRTWRRLPACRAHPPPVCCRRSFAPGPRPGPRPRRRGRLSRPGRPGRRA